MTEKVMDIINDNTSIPDSQRGRYFYITEERPGYPTSSSSVYTSYSEAFEHLREFVSIVLNANSNYTFRPGQAHIPCPDDATEVVQSVDINDRNERVTTFVLWHLHMTGRSLH